MRRSPRGDNKIQHSDKNILTVPKPESPKGGGINVRHSDKESDHFDDNSDDNNTSQDSGNLSRSSGKSIYPNISDLPCDANVYSNSVTYKHASRFNTSTSSASGDDVDGIKTPKPSLYPPLEGCNIVLASSESKKNTLVQGECKITAEKYKNVENVENSYFLLSAVISVIISILVWYLVRSNLPEPTNTSAEPPFGRFVNHVSNMEQIFPNQNTHLWRTVKASAMHVFHDENSNYPIVILMAAPVDRAHISRCIASKITSGFELVHGLSPVKSATDARDLQQFDPPSQKQKLDEHLQSAFSRKQRKSFIIDNLQLLHPEAALLLHGYCDGDNAPYKDVMIVLLLHIDEKDVMEFSSKAAENYLEQLWSRGLDVDKVKAILSRVANNIVIVETEDNETFMKTCVL